MMRPCPVEKICAWAHATPEQIAVSDQTTALTYHQLLCLAQEAASRLRDLNVQQGDFAGIWLPNSAAYVVAVCACLISGVVFVPLPDSDPLERVRRLADASGIRAVFTTDDRIRANDLGALPALNIPTCGLEANILPVQHTLPINPIDLVYCIFTSGSTGAPKGVMIRRESVANLVNNTIKSFGLHSKTKALCISPFHFDGAFGSLFSVLSAGGSLSIAPPGPMLPRQFVDLVERGEITHTSFSPSLLRLIVGSAALPRLGSTAIRTLGLGGEDLNPSDVQALRKAVPNIRVFNRYGPTETTIAVTSTEMTDELLARDEKLPVGLPISGVSFYLLDAAGTRISEPGVAGELCIGGVQVMQGYVGDCVMTQNVLRADLVPGEIVYRTGDLMMTNARGEYVYLDRLDHVIKRDGNRISLAEVQGYIEALPGVAEVACISTLRDARNFITAVICGTDLDRARIRSDLKHYAPAYMIPDEFHIVDFLPRLSSGKIDLQKLRQSLLGGSV